MTTTIDLEHSNRRLSYELARDEEDNLQWRSGLVDPIIPQQGFGDFGYNTQPFKINTPITFEHWTGGAGLLLERPGAISTPSYSYSQGVDASWGGRCYLSPARQASTNLTNTWKRAKFTSLGVFVLVADEVWEWDSGTSAFVTRLSGAGVTPTDLVEFEGNIYVAMGDSADYQYSANGTAWTASTLTVKRFDQFAVRSGQDGSARLWGILSTGELRQTDNGVNGGTQWSAATQIGDTWETLHQMVTAADFLYIFKEEGIYSFDGLIVEDVFPSRQLAIPNNGKQAVYWSDGYIYTNYGNVLWQFDPAARTMRQVFPLKDRPGHPEVNGEITGLGADGTHIYFVLKNAAGNTYIMRGQPSYADDEDSEWHTWTYLGANDANVVAPIRAGAIDGSNPVVLFDYGDVAGWYIQPGPGLRPEDDASYRYELTGTIIGPWVDGGTLLHTKLMSAGRVVTEAGTKERFVRFDYGTDGYATFTELAQTEGAGLVFGIPPATVRFSRIRYQGYLETDVNTDSPALGGFVFDALPTPMKHREFTFAVDCGDLQAVRGGGKLPTDSRELVDHLFAASGMEVLLYDRRGRRFVCFIDDVEQGVMEPTGLKDRETYVVRAIEIGVQGYLSTWYGIGSKYLLPDLPGGAVGQQTDPDLPDDEEDPSTELPLHRIVINLQPDQDIDFAFWGGQNETFNSYLRFKNVPLPADATVVTAIMRLSTFSVWESAGGGVDVDLYCDDEDSGTAPITYTLCEAMNLTTATVRWQRTITTGEFKTLHDSEDFASSVQEVIERAGWVNGNDITVVGKQRAVTGDLFVEYQNAVYPDQLGPLPQLIIEYTVPA